MGSIGATATIHTDILIVGTGPAGASLACFLGFHGITGLIISRDTSTAVQPRAHYTNPGAWECLRDIGLEYDWRKVSSKRETFGEHRFCASLLGPDLIRLHANGRHPSHLGEYDEASPCVHGDVPQNVGEPILLKYATQNGFQSRFNCTFVDFEQNPSTGLITSTVLDQLTHTTLQIVSKYLCGADGANSKIAQQAQLPFSELPSNGLAVNIWYEADLSHIYGPNPGILNSCLTPDVDPPPWGVRGVNRMIRPQSEYLMVLLAAPGVTELNATDEEVLLRLRQLIGDPNIPVKIKQISSWTINEKWAENVSKDNQIFCLGDAIHRHPPGNGLGSNTCIQDAYNLAWKLAYVLQGKAGPEILSSYNDERQPVGKAIVKVANDAIRYFIAVDMALGLMEPTVDRRLAAIKQLGEASPEGEARRAALNIAYENMKDEQIGLGAEMNQAYESVAVFTVDEPQPNPRWPEGSPGIRHHTISTYPGSRLPHAWLGTSKFGEKVSTHDIAGKGQFTLFTGISGHQAWTQAVQETTVALGGNVHINVRCIGFGQEYTDMYQMWAERRGVGEDGAVLVRPDRTVAWRSTTVNPQALAQLPKVMTKILAIKQVPSSLTHEQLERIPMGCISRKFN